MTDIAILIVLSVWFVFSILWQFKFEFLQPINSYDIFQMLPNWTFFAPNPGTVDYHLIYRVRVSDIEENMQWKEVPIIQNRKLKHLIWNYQRRKIKLIIDSINALVKINDLNSKFKLSQENSTKALYVSVPYLLIMKAVINEIRQSENNENIQFQFAIVESYGYIERHEPKYIIVSSFHKN
jgi:hypothetical protein